MLCGNGVLSSCPVPPRFQCDAVILAGDAAVEDPHVKAGVRINPVPVEEAVGVSIFIPPRIDGDAVHRDMPAEDGMQAPERGLPDRDSIQVQAVRVLNADGIGAVCLRGIQLLLKQNRAVGVNHPLSCDREVLQLLPGSGIEDAGKVFLHDALIAVQGRRKVRGVIRGPQNRTLFQVQGLTRRYV